VCMLLIVIYVLYVCVYIYAEGLIQNEKNEIFL